MVKVGTTWDNKRKYFACDECGICEQFERRMNIANELGECLQFDHCSCDKIDAEFFAGGYCEDAIVKIPKVKSVGKRKTGLHIDEICTKKSYRNTVAKMTGSVACISVVIGRVMNISSAPM